jgi:hypothetical protein
MSQEEVQTSLLDDVDDDDDDAIERDRKEENFDAGDYRGHNLAAYEAMEAGLEFWEGEISAEEQERWRKWVTEESDSTLTGLFTIAYMHGKSHPNKTNTQIALMVTSLLMVRVLQIVLPVLLVAANVINYDKGFCPSSATVMPRIAMCGISSMYAVRFLFKGLAQQHMYYILPNNFSWDGRLSYVTGADQFFEMYVEGAVNFANLFLVFIQPGVTDMIANCLYMEFITQLDDQIRDAYLNTYSGSAEWKAWGRENLRLVTGDEKVFGCICGCYDQVAKVPMLCFAPIGFILAIATTACKV